MAKSTGQDSAPRADICTASVQDARAQQRQDGDKRSQRVALNDYDRLWVALRHIAAEIPLTRHDVLFLMTRHRAPGDRKGLLLSLHARGLVTDEQVERAFAQHPELGERP